MEADRVLADQKQTEEIKRADERQRERDLLIQKKKVQIIDTQSQTSSQGEGEAIPPEQYCLTTNGLVIRGLNGDIIGQLAPNQPGDAPMTLFMIPKGTTAEVAH